MLLLLKYILFILAIINIYVLCHIKGHITSVTWNIKINIFIDNNVGNDDWKIVGNSLNKDNFSSESYGEVNGKGDVSAPLLPTLLLSSTLIHKLIAYTIHLNVVLEALQASFLALSSAKC